MAKRAAWLAKASSPGEGEIVSVAGVRGAGGTGETGKAAIETPAAEVGDGRRSGRALREVGTAIEGSGYL